MMKQRKNSINKIHCLSTTIKNITVTNFIITSPLFLNILYFVHFA